MSGKKRRINLVIPGLFGSFPHASPAPHGNEFPSLQRLLNRGTFAAEKGAAVSNDFEQQMAVLLGYPVSAATSLPIASVCRLADGFSRDDAYYLRADPVHLRADQDKVYLAAIDALQVHSDEAAQLVAVFNALYAGEGWELAYFHPQRWYLRLPVEAECTTFPPMQALGKSIEPYLPVGKEGLRWRAVMNEAQMLFFTQPVNQQREHTHQLTINGLWLWGGGHLPDEFTAPFSCLWSDEAWSRGLALLGGCNAKPLPASMSECAHETNGIVVLDGLRYPALTGHQQDWLVVMRDYEQNWFSPLLDALMGKQLDEAFIHPGNGKVIRLTRSALRRWWRRCRPLSYYVE